YTSEEIALMLDGRTKDAVQHRSRHLGLRRPGSHGHTKGDKQTSEYRAWWGTIARCTNPKNISYKNYGARGIRVCPQWMKFDQFIADMGLKPSPKYSLDRINNDGDYEPSNCRWATKDQQLSNRRNNLFITFHGRTMTCKQWARELGLSH